MVQFINTRLYRPHFFKHSILVNHNDDDDDEGPNDTALSSALHT